MSNISTDHRPARSGRGCLWGCLGVAVILLTPLIFAWGYGAWFVYQGFRESPMMRTAIEMVRKDGLAQQVLGPDIAVTGMAQNMFSFVPGMGARNRYVLELGGARGDGTLEVTSHTEGAKAKIDGMILTGPDGRRYDLLTDTPLPGAPGARPLNDTI